MKLRSLPSQHRHIQTTWSAQLKHGKGTGRTHVVKHEIDIAVVLSTNNVKKTNHVLVAGKLLQIHDLTKGALRIGGVTKGIETFFERHHLPRPLVCRLPYNAVRLHDLHTANSTTVMLQSAYQARQREGGWQKRFGGEGG